MSKEEAIENVLLEIDLWLDMYDKDSECYARLVESIEVLREAV